MNWTTRSPLPLAASEVTSCVSGYAFGMTALLTYRNPEAQACKGRFQGEKLLQELKPCGESNRVTCDLSGPRLRFFKSEKSQKQTGKGQRELPRCGPGWWVWARAWCC